MGISGILKFQEFSQPIKLPLKSLKIIGWTRLWSQIFYPSTFPDIDFKIRFLRHVLFPIDFNMGSNWVYKGGPFEFADFCPSMPPTVPHSVVLKLAGCIDVHTQMNR